MSLIVHAPLSFDSSFVERVEVRVDCFLVFLAIFSVLQRCYTCKWLQFLDLVELNLQLQFYLAYTKTSTIVQIIEAGGGEGREEEVNL